MASLPKRNSDELSGNLMISAYVGKLGGYSSEQIAFLWDTVLDRCKWFPTIAECLEILSEWKRDDAAIQLQQRAKSQVFWDNQARFEDTMAALARGDVTQKEIDALPQNWREIAETRGHLWLHDDGSYTLRRRGTAPSRQQLVDRSKPKCAACQDIGRVLTLEGEEQDCTCAHGCAA
jgi:hypothetical protein